jgi:hypothetical protein
MEKEQRVRKLFSGLLGSQDPMLRALMSPCHIWYARETSHRADESRVRV